MLEKESRFAWPLWEEKIGSWCTHCPVVQFCPRGKKCLFREKPLHKNAQGTSIHAAWAVILISIFLNCLISGDTVLCTPVSLFVKW